MPHRQPLTQYPASRDRTRQGSHFAATRAHGSATRRNGSVAGAGVSRAAARTNAATGAGAGLGIHRSHTGGGSSIESRGDAASGSMAKTGRRRACAGPSVLDACTKAATGSGSGAGSQVSQGSGACRSTSTKAADSKPKSEVREVCAGASAAEARTKAETVGRSAHPGFGGCRCVPCYFRQSDRFQCGGEAGNRTGVRGILRYGWLYECSDGFGCRSGHPEVAGRRCVPCYIHQRDGFQCGCEPSSRPGVDRSRCGGRLYDSGYWFRRRSSQPAFARRRTFDKRDFGNRSGFPCRLIRVVAGSMVSGHCAPRRTRFLPGCQRFRVLV